MGLNCCNLELRVHVLWSMLVELFKLQMRWHSRICPVLCFIQQYLSLKVVLMLPYFVVYLLFKLSLYSFSNK